jgi:Spy/CpxP family protein refolding chaperone
VNSWKVIFATIVIFGAGVITGGLLVGHVALTLHPGRPHAQNTNQGDILPAAVTPDILRKQFVQRLNDKLDLSEQQKDQIKKVIEQGQENTRNLWKIVAPQFQEIWRDTRQQIREVLTPEQRQQFELLMKQQHQMHHPQETNAPAATPVPTNGPAV